MGVVEKVWSSIIIHTIICINIDIRDYVNVYVVSNIYGYYYYGQNEPDNESTKKPGSRRVRSTYTYFNKVCTVQESSPYSVTT